MATRFDDWEGEYLEHHGIRGMKWGVRRYQNEDGSLTEAGKRRYGFGNGEGRAKTSARKMQRDFNNLDKGYANVAAEKHYSADRFNKQIGKTVRYAQKKGYKSDLSEHRKTDRKLDKLLNKSEKLFEKTAKADKQMKEIEALQLKIMAKASEKGYTVTSKPVVRVGKSGRDRVMSTFDAIAAGAAPVGGAVYIPPYRSGLRVDGQKVRIRKDGSGKQELVNYSGINRAERRQAKRAAMSDEITKNAQVQRLANKKRELEKKYRVYGDDLDGWTPKTGKKDYGIDQKQYDSVMKARSEYKQAKEAYKSSYGHGYTEAGKATRKAYKIVKKENQRKG